MTIENNIAINRDKFMTHLINFLHNLKTKNIHNAKDILEKIIENYAPPEGNQPDFELARAFKILDDLIYINSEWQSFFSTFSSNLMANNVLPEWAASYLQSICSANIHKEDRRRILLLKKLWKNNSTSLEAGFLLATSLTQDACDTHNEKKFKDALGVYSQIEKVLPPAQDRLPIFRTGSLFSKSSHETLEEFKIWVLENYIEFLKEERRIPEAIQLIISHPNYRDSSILLPTLRLLELEKRLREDFSIAKQTKTKNRNLLNRLTSLFKQ